MIRQDATTTPRSSRIPLLLVWLLASLTPAIAQGQVTTVATSHGHRGERAAAPNRSPETPLTAAARPGAMPGFAAPPDEVLLSDSRNYPEPARFAYVANAARLPDVGFVLFDLDSAELSSSARATLDAVCRSANDGPVPFDLTVEGHASDEGNAGLPGTTTRLRFEQYNYELSVERARATADYLRDHCMQGDRVSFYGLGLQDHVDRLHGLDPRQRRVEIKMRSHDPTWTSPETTGESAPE